MNNVIFPFGPPIYINQVDDNIIKELDARIEETGVNLSLMQVVNLQVVLKNKHT